MNTWSVVLLAFTIIMEARNQPVLGQAMVAQVAMNRSTIVTVEEVLFQPGQFSVWARNAYAPGYTLRTALLAGSIYEELPDNPWYVEDYLGRATNGRSRFRVGSQESWDQVYSLAEQVYEGSYEFPPELENKTHFDNPDNWPNGLPPWMVNCIPVGDHVFCD